MNIISLKKGSEKIELLVNDDFDLSLITSSADKLFELKALYKTALKDFMSDYKTEFQLFQELTECLKHAGVIGYPVTPMKDARLYALDKKIIIESEMTISI